MSERQPIAKSETAQGQTLNLNSLFETGISNLIDAYPGLEAIVSRDDLQQALQREIVKAMAQKLAQPIVDITTAIISGDYDELNSIYGQNRTPWVRKTILSQAGELLTNPELSKEKKEPLLLLLIRGASDKNQEIQDAASRAFKTAGVIYTSIDISLLGRVNRI